MAREALAIPNEFQEIHGRFERWRSTRRPGTPIPRALWVAVVAVARRQGVFRTARALHLDSHKLKTIMDVPRRTQPDAAPPSFVELVAPSGSGGTCIVEVEGPHGGRLRVQLTGTALPDLVALSRIVCGTEA